MNVDDVLRSGLHDLADEVSEISDLHRLAVQRGQHRRSVRRATAAGGAVLSVVAVAGIGVVVADSTGGIHHSIQPGDGTQNVVADPWWQSWQLGRHDGAVDPHFLASISSTPGNAVYAAGTTPDGTEWAMLTSPPDGHKIGWFVGADGQAQVGDVPDEVDPELTWTSWSAISRATYNDEMGPNHQWLIIVGRPGTTGIDYSPDGTTWQTLDTQDGIAVTYVQGGFPPATARVRLSDSTGVYAEGTPEAAGAGQSNPSPSPTPSGLPSPLATPTPTPTTS